jgi:tetratricopeptide (TPR) repeat protein
LSTAHELLARIALARHDPDLARAEATLAEKADSTRPIRAYVEGRIALDRHRYVEAFESFDLALTQLAKTPGEPLMDLRLSAAESLLHLQRFEEAEALFREELEELPDSARARAGLSALYRATGGRDRGAVSQHE